MKTLLEIKKNRVSLFIQACNQYKISQFVQNTLIKYLTYSMDVVGDSVMKEPEKEICICAAIKVRSGQIIRGHRHGDCFIVADKMHLLFPGDHTEQGFVISKNRFVDRVEGRKLQAAARIRSKSPEGYMPGTLFSEDLY